MNIFMYKIVCIRVTNLRRIHTLIETSIYIILLIRISQSTILYRIKFTDIFIYTRINFISVCLYGSISIVWINLNIRAEVSRFSVWTQHAFSISLTKS